MRRLRIIAGDCGGQFLDYPRGADPRPTSDRVRESLFSSLDRDLPGALFADLFAGTGAVGLEALSRGARRALFVENDPRCMQAIRANVAKLALQDQAVLGAGPVETLWPRLAREWGPFDIVFVDPPYAYRRWDGLLQMLLVQALGVRPDSLILLQHPRVGAPELPVPALRTKTFGETELTWLRPRPAGEGPAHE